MTWVDSSRTDLGARPGFAASHQAAREPKGDNRRIAVKDWFTLPIQPLTLGFSGGVNGGGNCG